MNSSRQKLACGYKHTRLHRVASRYSRAVDSRGSPDRLSLAEQRAWQGLLRVLTLTLRALDTDLKRQHGLSESKYDVLIQLGLAKSRRLSMTRLATQVLMSQSGLSRMVDELEREGLLARERDDADARSYNLVLTTAGRTRLRAANRTHLRGVRELLLDKLSDDQLAQLADIWSAIDSSLAP